MAQTNVDVKVAVKGEGDLNKLLKRMNALEKEVNQLNAKLPKTANAIKATGRAAKPAAAGVRGLGAAFKAALGPIGLALAGIGGLTEAFKTLSTQDFAEAKVRSLGVNSGDLKKQLEGVSRELKGQASVVELTGAAYDVASAGFNDAASAAKILKAASLGATGGFSDINTVANATTSVLNAYGLSASSAGALVDQFIQTQNDGKIVVEQYAREIGKVAAAAAGLGVPLSEVNAVIAQSTASGVKAEVAFTGLKTALARFASGEAQKALEGTGVSISAASLEAEGLIGTFKKLEGAGLDTGQIFKALGTEAAPALLPVLNNLERYEELLENQKNAAGVAAQAQATAAGTIQGAWKRVTSAVQNIFSDQSELGQIIRVTLLAAAATVEALGAAFKILVAPIRALINAIGGIAKAMGVVTDAESQLNDFTGVWFKVLDAASLVADVIVDSGTRWGNFLGGLITQVRGWFDGLWGGISEGVGGVVPAITGAFAAAFNAVKGMVESFWNSLPGWLRGALEMAGSVVGGVANAVGGAISAVKNEIEFAVKNADGAAGELFSGITQPKVPTLASPTGSTDGGGGGGGADKAAQEAQREREKAAQQLKSAQNLAFASENQLRLAKEMTDLQRIGEEYAVKRLEIENEYAEKLEASKSAAETALLQVAQTNELKTAEIEKEQALKDLREGAVASIDEEIARLTAKIEGKEKEYLITKKIKELEAAGVEGAAGKVNQLEDLKARSAAADELKASYESLANSVAGEMTGAFKAIITGSKSAEEALSDAFAGIADAFLDMALKMIQQWLVMKIMGMFGGGMATGAGGMPTSGMGGMFNLSGGQFGSFAGGGYTGDGARSGGVDGQGGFPAILHPQETVVDHSSAMGKYSPGGGGAAAAGEAGADAASGGGVEAEGPMSINISGGVMQMGNENYIKQDQLPSIISQASKAGEARALRRLQMSPSARRKVGM